MKKRLRCDDCWLIVALMLGCGAARGQSAEPTPIYSASQPVRGVIRVWGDYHQKAMLLAWEKAFAKVQPGVTFDNQLTSTVHGIPALVFKVADVALLGREIQPLENLSFRRMFKYDPTEIATATGSFNTPYQAFAPGIFVNKQNPLTKMTFEQARAIFGCGSGHDARTWGDVGLTGEWADKPIHVLGYPSSNNIAAFFELKVLAGPSAGGPTLPEGARWNCEMKEYENTYDENDKPVVSSDTFMFRDLGSDRYAIAYSGIAEITEKVKPLALAVRTGAPYVEFTREHVVDRTYPLTRSMYMYVNKAPGKLMDAKVAEFVRFVLSREGQEATAEQKVFLPLTAEAVREQRKKLE